LNQVFMISILIPNQKKHFLHVQVLCWFQINDVNSSSHHKNLTLSPGCYPSNQISWFIPHVMLFKKLVSRKIG
jgi:hypothetical protein